MIGRKDDTDWGRDTGGGICGVIVFGFFGLVATLGGVATAWYLIG